MLFYRRGAFLRELAVIKALFSNWQISKYHVYRLRGVRVQLPVHVGDAAEDVWTWDSQLFPFIF